jgi:septum formation protein
MAIIEISRPIVLATASPARRKLVEDAGIPFAARVVEIDESPAPGEGVSGYVERLARAKAEAVGDAPADSLIVAVDTAIGIDGRIIGKPAGEGSAREMLGALSGRTHVVVSAIAVRDDAAGSVDAEVTSTEVSFSELTSGMIDWYVSTGEWRGRAGAYAIQGRGAALVSAVDGCFTNVIGISMPAFIRMLRRTPR